MLISFYFSSLMRERLSYGVGDLGFEVEGLHFFRFFTWRAVGLLRRLEFIWLSSLSSATVMYSSRTCWYDYLRGFLWVGGYFDEGLL